MLVNKFNLLSYYYNKQTSEGVTLYTPTHGCMSK